MAKINPIMFSSRINANPSCQIWLLLLKSFKVLKCYCCSCCCRVCRCCTQLINRAHIGIYSQNLETKRPKYSFTEPCCIYTLRKTTYNIIFIQLFISHALPLCDHLISSVSDRSFHLSVCTITFRQIKVENRCGEHIRCKSPQVCL